MADDTRLKQLDESNKKLSLDLQELGTEVKGNMSRMKTDINNQLHLLRTAQSSLDQKLQLLLDRSVFSQSQNYGGETNQHWEEEEQPDPSSSNPFQGFQHHHQQRFIQHHQTGEGQFANYRPKIDFPRFDGTNPRAWIRKCKKYFFLHQLNDEQKVHIATLYLEGKADVWFQHYQTSKANLYWEDFIIDVCTRFQDLGHDNVIGEFNKLDQTTRVLDYKERFEELKALMLAKNPSLYEEYFIHSFISGLKEDIRLVVQMFNPTTLQQAILLARRQECILDRAAKPQPRFSNIPSYGGKPLTIPNQTTHFTPSVMAPTITSPATSPKMQHVKKLTYVEMRAKRENGLCYNCNEPWIKGHDCRKQQLYMIVADDEEGLKEKDDGSSPTIVKVDEEMEISVHALAGNISQSTIKIKGQVKTQGLTILVDNGSTHSFLDPSAAKRSGCTILPTQTLQVTVADGNKLLSQAKCPEFTWVMQGHTFSHDLHLLDLGGCDMVLGADWMRELSPMLFDFKKLTITFKHNGTDVELIGHREEAVNISLMTGRHFKKLLRSGDPVLFGQLSSISATAASTDIAAQIAEVLD
ncbi:uncharacterized protein LOC113340978 [Papaver somniferum]|uniref:uncharacterized protein LOC113340978 n=1 Tax=Papaver somniferum TaxID=3469 RepID=UPI000E6F8514|nr:uncharacterized protein LOC113340978 [Papaver somniferum]XP_026441803.1 uncharacterized protein LOC113340978 [Papaver somniferum]